MAERGAFTPPDPTGLEAWIRQVLGLAGARASAFTPPLPLSGPGTPPGPAEPPADGRDEPRAEEPAGPGDAG